MNEAWLRGPIAGIPPVLQPVAHALIGAREEVESTLATLSADKLWTRPPNSPSVGFHVKHALGSLDRLFTYARGQALSREQLAILTAEAALTLGESPSEVVADFRCAIDRALGQLQTTDERTLLEPRGVGRQKLPSTVIGLLFHGAEHTARHVGQMKTTSRVVAAL
jgi:hypothetical protein